MLVSNVRQGIATNSSSSHSIIISSQLNKITDELCDDSFGWQYFVAHSPKTKLEYLSILLSSQIESISESDLIAELAVSKWCDGHSPNPNTDIDHQSVFRFPYTYGTNIIDKQFFQEFKEFILRPDIAIIGGNDNGGDDHPLRQKIKYTNLSALLPFVKERSYSTFWCRKDGEHWTVFDKSNLRYTFSYDSFIQPVVKYQTPLLVDLKITDYCTTGCSFCYQSSTKKGKHGRLDKIKGCLDALAKLKVFEVAIGGGNPVSHPNFIEILEYAKSIGITPNFSTRDLSFLDSEEDSKRIFNAIGNFAYSVNPTTPLEHISGAIAKIEKLKKLRENRFDYKGIMNFQLFIGPGGFQMSSQLEPILALAREQYRSVTLLGFKQVGRSRGVAYSEYPEANSPIDLPYNLVPTLFKLQSIGKCPDIGVDTVLANSIKYTLEESQVSNKLFVLDEGKSSCYIDAVTETIAKSSFDDSVNKINITKDNEIKTIFSTY